MAAPLGVTFKPSEQQSALGPKQAGKEGYQQAIQMISLRYPKILGARSPVGDPSLLAGQGAPRISGFNPDAAILQALIRAFAGGPSTPNTAGQPGTQPAPRGLPREATGGLSRALTSRLPAPSFTTIDAKVPAPPVTDFGPSAPGWTPPPAFESSYEGQGGQGGYVANALARKANWMDGLTREPFL